MIFFCFFPNKKVTTPASDNGRIIIYNYYWRAYYYTITIYRRGRISVPSPRPFVRFEISICITLLSRPAVSSSPPTPPRGRRYRTRHVTRPDLVLRRPARARVPSPKTHSTIASCGPFSAAIAVNLYTCTAARESPP